MVSDATGVDAVLGDEGYQVAFVVATIGTAVVWWLLHRHSFPVGAAVVAVIAALLGLQVEFDLDGRFVIGLALLALASVIEPNAPGWRLVALVGGALLLAGQLSGAAGWMQVVAFGSIVVGAPLAVRLDRQVPRVMPLLVLASAGGIYACAPDTEATKVVLGALVPVALLALEPRLRASAATFSLVGLVVWVAVLEGRGRPGAVIGSVACLGVIVVAPLVRWRSHAFGAVVVLLATHAVLVLWVSRVAGLRNSAWVALALCVPAFALAALVLALVNRRATP